MFRIGGIAALLGVALACGTGGEGSDQGDTTGACAFVTCGENAYCKNVGESSTECVCDSGYFGNGSACTQSTTATGTCEQGPDGNTIVCECNPGYEHASDYATACTDLNECDLPEGERPCDAHCVNTEGSFECISTVADPTSPYWADSCDPFFDFTEAQTQLIADCRCGNNRQPLGSGGLDVCQRPSNLPATLRIGDGPSVRELERNFLRALTGVVDPAARVMFVGGGWTNPDSSYRGWLFEVNVDTGDRRIVSGDWITDAGFVPYGTGPFLDEVQNLAFGPDGDLYAWTRAVDNRAQIVSIDRTTGNRRLIWKEHNGIDLNDPTNNPAHAQCDNGNRGIGRRFVQVWERGFLVDDDGSFILSAAANGTAEDTTPVGLIRISPDGATCTWVTAVSQGDNNVLPVLGAGLGPQGSVEFQNLFWVDDRIYAFDSFADLWSINPTNGDRLKLSAGSQVAEDYLSWDEARQAWWMTGAGGGANNVQMWWPDDGTKYSMSGSDDLYDVKGFTLGRTEGPIDTCCQNHLPSWYDNQRGVLLLWHDLYALVALEPETGNSVILSH